MRVDEHTSGLPALARRAGPTALAAALAIGYLIAQPRSADLAAALLRVKLFGTEGFGLWDNWWYAGHYLPSYSVLFPALGWLAGPRLLAAVAAVLAAASFEALARGRFGSRAWLGAAWFGAATVTPLLSGRLTFALGLLGALATALALQRGRPWAAATAAFLTALASPVAALFAALAGAAHALNGPRAHARSGAAVVVAGLLPVALLALAFPEGGHEPFAFSALWPIPLIGAGLLLAAPGGERALRAGIALYVTGCLLAYALPTPVGGNAARLGALAAGPIAALLLYPRRLRLLLACAPALVYLQWHAAIADVAAAQSDPSTTAAYYRPLVGFLERAGRAGGDLFRIEIPFTVDHWEAYEVAPRFPLARGWERQLDIADNALFYRPGALTPTRYDAWLHALAVRFVALPDARLDRSARAEAALIRSRPRFLTLVFASRHWRVYAVANPAPLASGAARLTSLGPDSATLRADRPGRTLVRIRWSPYWRLADLPGCVAPAGRFLAVTVARAGTARLVIDFAPGRIGARSPRCG